MLREPRAAPLSRQAPWSVQASEWGGLGALPIPAGDTSLAYIPLEGWQTQVISPGTNKPQVGSSEWGVPVCRGSKDRSLPGGERSSAGEAQLLSRGRAGVAASVPVLAGLWWVLFFKKIIFLFLVNS